MNKLLADSAARAAALDPTRSFIVEAAAGSGKTALLTQRFLVLLARVAAPEEVVAITFTRKAAGEMRGRVLAALNLPQTETDSSESGPAQQAQQVLTRAVLARDAECGWRLRENPHRLRILTIDALIGGLVRRLPLQSGLMAGSGLREDARDLYRRAARRTLLTAEESEGEWAHAMRHVLSDLDNDWRKLETLLANMLGRRDQWLPLVTSAPSRASLDAARARLVARALAKLAATCPASLKVQLVEIAGWIGQTVEARAPDTPAAGLARFNAAANDLEGWQLIAKVLLTKTGSARRKPEKTFAPGTQAEAGSWRRDYQAHYQALVTALDAAPAWVATLHAARQLPSPRYNDHEFARLHSLLTVLRLAAANLRVVSAEHAATDFPEHTLAALTALGEPDNPTDLALAMDYQLSHLLVDEFQDTSRIQYALLERLTAGWSGTEQRTLFMVGDPMQSIYRFRDADVNLFSATVASSRFGNIPLHRLRLNVNFRTCPAVLSWLNDTLATAFAAADSALPPFHPFQAIREDAPLCGVQMHLAGPESLASQMLDIINATWVAQPDATIAILVRSRAHLGDVPQRLAAAGVPIATNDIDALIEIPIVNDLMALTRALYDLTDRVAWLAVLRAPWCGSSLADLHALAGPDRDILIWEWLNDDSAIARFAPNEAARVLRVRDILATALAARGRVAYPQLVEFTWRWLGAASLASGHDLRYAHRFFELLDTLEQAEELLNGHTLERHVAEQFAPFPRRRGPTVEIMTIHHAKGLEFDVVLIPELQRTVRAESRSLLLDHAEIPGSQEPGVPELCVPELCVPELCVLAPLPAIGPSDDALYEYLRARAKAATGAEGYRLLYVALTRACNALHLFCSPLSEDKAPPNGSFLGMLWSALGETIACLPPPTVHSATLPVTPPRRRLAMSEMFSLPSGEVGAGAPRAPLPFEWASPLAKPIGTVTHAFLQLLANDLRFAEAGTTRVSTQIATQIPGQTAIRARLRALGLRGSDIDFATREVQSALAATLASQRGRWLFAPTHRDAHSEYRIATVGERVADVIVDRTFVTADGVRWIVDFKTGTHEGSDLERFMASEVTRYRPQLETYARAFARLEHRPVMLGLYYPRLDAWREWPALAASAEDDPHRVEVVLER